MESEEQHRYEESWGKVERKLAGYFFRQGCREEEVRDLVQETALRGWLNYASLRGDFSAWVFGIARHVFIDYLRKRKPEPIHDPAPLDSDPGSKAISKALLHQCLTELDPMDRRCLILHDFEGLSYKEIAEAIGKSLSNAHYHVEKARSYLRERFPELVDASSGKVKT